MLHACAPVWDDPKKKLNRVAVAWRCKVCGFYSEDVAATRAHIWAEA